MFSISFSEKLDKYFFQLGERYKIRLQFNNSIVLYSYMFAYKHRHASIDGITNEIIHNLFDSDHLKIQYMADSGKKVTMKFSLKGSTPAINVTTSRAEDKLKEMKADD